MEIILANNGYDVVNLGIKVPPEELIQACHKHSRTPSGLSGLLVKSAQQMVITAGDLRDAGIELPLLVGGAALSDKFTRSKIAPSYAGLTLYAKDAMTGLRLMNEIMDPARRDKLLKSAINGGAAQPAARSRKPRLPVERSGAARECAPTFPFRRPHISIAKSAICRNLAELWSLHQSLHALRQKFRIQRKLCTQALQERDPRAIELLP